MDFHCKAEWEEEKKKLNFKEGYMFSRFGFYLICLWFYFG